MNWLVTLIKAYPQYFGLLPAGLIIAIAGYLLFALSDGKIDDQEKQVLISLASGIDRCNCTENKIGLQEHGSIYTHEYVNTDKIIP